MGPDAVGATRRPATRELTDRELAALHEQRDFLLRSLDDLEAEHDAGDVGDDDYEVLRDDYTSRAARVLRTIERHRARPEGGGDRARGGGRSRRWRPLVVLAAVVAFAVGAGVLVAQASGRRTSGESATGDIRTTTRTELSRASDLVRQGAYGEAVAVYDGILDDQPEHVEAMTYKGWAQVLGGRVEDGVMTLNGAVELDPGYPDAHAFLVVTYYRLSQDVEGRTELRELFRDRARGELQALDELEVPPSVEQLLAGIRADLQGGS